MNLRPVSRHKLRAVARRRMAAEKTHRWKLQRAGFARAVLLGQFFVSRGTDQSDREIPSCKRTHLSAPHSSCASLASGWMDEPRFGPVPGGLRLGQQHILVRDGYAYYGVIVEVRAHQCFCSGEQHCSGRRVPLRSGRVGTSSLLCSGSREHGRAEIAQRRERPIQVSLYPCVPQSFCTPPSRKFVDGDGAISCVGLIVSPSTFVAT